MADSCSSAGEKRCPTLAWQRTVWLPGVARTGSPTIEQVCLLAAFWRYIMAGSGSPMFFLLRLKPVFWVRAATVPRYRVEALARLCRLIHCPSIVCAASAAISAEQSAPTNLTITLPRRWQSGFYALSADQGLSDGGCFPLDCGQFGSKFPRPSLARVWLRNAKMACLSQHACEVKDTIEWQARSSPPQPLSLGLART